MESRTAILKRHGHFLMFFVVFLTTCCLQVMMAPFSISLDRATESALLIDIRYIFRGIKEEDLTWQHKSSPEEEWKNYTETMVHGHNPKAFYILGLRKQSQHFIRVLVTRYGIISNEINATTCPETTPTVDDLRVASVGPGWIDIRWKRPYEDCQSFFLYYVAYRVGNGPFSAAKRFGYIDTPGTFASVHPHHPCENYPQEFCVLLTDRVQAGQKHTVKVYVDRLDSLSPVSDTTSIDVVAEYSNSKLNPELQSSHSAFQCEEANTTKYENSDVSHSVIQQQISLPVWVIVVVAIVIIIILVAIIITSIFLSVRNKNTEVVDSSHRENISNASQPIRYVRNFRTPERMNNISAEAEAPEYEEIHFGKSQTLNQKEREKESEKKGRGGKKKGKSQERKQIGQHNHNNYSN